MPTSPLPSDLAIARAAHLEPIAAVAEAAGIPQERLEPYGRHVAKIDLAAVADLAGRPRARYVVITAITPTPLGEGKTTTAVGLAQGLSLLGHRATLALRQPSMGPTFGIKGGAAGAGYSQVLPMETLNLHLTGDFHAVTAAHNLLAAMVDNHLHHGNELGLDPRSIAWRRVLDVNDRALRNIVVGLGARIDGVPRQSGFDITAASEVMVILALSTSLRDLRERLGRIVVGLHAGGAAGDGGGPQGRGRDGGHAQGRHQAEPAADHREHAGPRPHRALRQHRHRQLLGRGGPHRHPGPATTCSPRPASAPTWGPSGSSTSSAGCPGCGRTPPCSWSRCAR